MRDSQRVLVNTIAQYTRTIINMLLSLYTVRVVLATLGVSDYGIYTLIAGVVAMLGFITNSLVESTQRFVSYYQGKGNLNELKQVFNNSLVIHIILGLVVIFILELLSPFLFEGFLNIPESRNQAAMIIYHLVVLMLLVTFVASPFRALLISHENIVYISCVDVIDGVLKVALVIMMTHTYIDKLIFYGCIMLFLQVFIFLALSVYCYIKYDECVWPNLKKLQMSYVKEMSTFAGWKLYGTACTVGRSQGISVVLNRAFGTAINAGWGIGAQIAGYTDFLTSAIVNAMAPQIVKAEGRGERERAIWLSYVLSKLVFFLMSVIAIPLLFEITNILTLWLENPPETAALFSTMFIMALLVDSMTIGLTHINNAIGKIGRYIFTLNTPKFFTFVFAWLLIKMGCPAYSVCIVYVFIELVCSFIRIPLIKQRAGIDVSLFFRNVVLRELLPVLLCVVVCYGVTELFSFKFRFALTFALSSVIYSFCMYKIGLTSREKAIVKDLCYEMLSKIGGRK